MTLPLTLSVSHSNWRLFMVRKHDQRFLTFQQKVFARDQYRCQFCGFAAKQWMDVVNRDGNFHRNPLDNLVTACCLCTQCFFMESVGRDEFGGGVLIACPDMTQAELNALCHVLFTAMVSGGRLATQARTVYRGLRLRAQQVEKMLGEGLSQPALLGRLLVDHSGAEAADFQQQLQQGLRLLPDLQRFAQPVKDWIAESLQLN